MIQATSTEKQSILFSTDSNNDLEVMLGKQSTWASLLWQKNRPLKIPGQTERAVALHMHNLNKTSVQFWCAPS